MECFITSTGSFLPGEPIDNDSIERFLGRVEHEEKVKRQVLSANGIKTRHYAIDESQQPTFDVYQMAALAIERALVGATLEMPVTYLSAGSTHTPLSGPGMSSILHGTLARRDSQAVNHPLEINSNAGICTSAAAGLVNAYRAIKAGDHQSAICVGAEEPSRILKSSVIRPPHDTEMIEKNLTQSDWFMSVFLRFMLSDGAGACLLQNQPASGGISLKVNWTYSRSFANEAPLCMKMESGGERVTQDVKILSRYLFKCADKCVEAALNKHDESLDQYHVLLPHISSFFFRRKMEKLIKKFTRDPELTIDYWTNLATAGNTGSASIFLMLDEYLRTKPLSDGDQIMLFVPESGQFNFVMVSLTAVQMKA